MEKEQKKTKMVLSGRKIVIMFSLGFAQSIIFLMPYINYGFYKPLQESLNCSNAQIGFLMTLMGIIEIISFFPGGWLADKFNPKKLIIIGLMATGICTLICAFVMKYAVYCVMWVVMAFAGDLLYWSSGMKSVRSSADADEQGKAYGYFYFFNNMTGTLVNAIGTALVAAVGALVLGFRYFIIFLGAMDFVAALVIWWLLPRPSTQGANAGGTNERKISIKDLKVILRRKETWLFSIIVFCLYTMLSAPSYFTPYFSDVMGLSVASAAAVYVITGPVSAFLGPIMGTFSDWIGSTLRTIVIVMIIVLLLVSFLLVYSGTLSLAVAIVIDVVLTAFTTGIYSIGFSSLEETGMDRQLSGSCIGLASIIGYCPDVFMFTIFGNWLDNYGNAGYTKIFGYCDVVTLIAIIAAAVLYAKVKKTKNAKNNAKAI